MGAESNILQIVIVSVGFGLLMGWLFALLMRVLGGLFRGARAGLIEIYRRNTDNPKRAYGIRVRSPNGEILPDDYRDTHDALRGASDFQDAVANARIVLRCPPGLPAIPSFPDPPRGFTHERFPTGPKPQLEPGPGRQAIDEA